jgi:hypothetical protein
MLYPDLCRLSLRSPATGAGAGEVLVPDTPPQPKRQRQQVQPQEEEEEEESETPQQEVLRQEGLLQLILFGLVDDDVESTCANAVKWCDLKNGHQGACDANVWKELTRRVFPNLRVPPFSSDQLDQSSPVVTRMHRAWFVYFCKEHKKLRDLKNALANQTRAIAKQYTGGNREWLMLKAKTMQMATEVEMLQKITRTPRTYAHLLSPDLRENLINRINTLRRAMRDVEDAKGSLWRAGAKPSLLMARAMREDKWAQLLRKIKMQEAHIRSYEQLSPGTHGPQTFEELLEEHRLEALDDLVRENDRHEQSYEKWLREREENIPWERDLSALVAEARALIEQNPRVPLNILNDVAEAVNKVERARRKAYPFQEDYRKGPEYYDVFDDLELRIGQLRKWLDIYPGRAGV